MATWETVKSYLASKYQVQLLDGDKLKLVFNLDQGRSQVVIVTWAGRTASLASWVDFHSPLGDLSDVDLAAAVTATEGYVGGGISTMAGLATLRVSVPLENLDRNEIEDPLELVCLAGDALEQKLTGQDTY